MKRVIIIAVAAVAALGVGATVGSTHQEHGSQDQTQTLPQDGQTWDQRMCEQAAQQIRARHPDAYIGGCNHGSGTIATP